MKIRLITALMLMVGTTACTSLFYTNQTPLSGQMESISRMMTPTEDPATGLYGYLGDLGIWVIKPQFKSAQRFSNGMARVKPGNYYGAINPLGQWVIKPVFSSSSDCDEAIGSIHKGRMAGIELWYEQDPATELYGFLNHFGEWHITPQYENVHNFDSDGFAIVKVVGGGWGAINRQNQMVIQPNFDYSYKAEDALRRLKKM